MYKRTNNNNNHHHHHFLLTGSTLQNETTDTAIKEKPFSKTILIVDDEPDITTSLKMGLEDNGFEVYTYNDPLEALSNFKPNFYDMLLIDINMPYMDGFELYEKLLKMDINMRICFISAAEVNEKAMREI